MLAAMLCLPALLILTGISVTYPVRHSASTQSCSAGKRSMPNLSGLALRSNPQVYSAGRVIKGLYYSQTSTGPHDVAAFHLTCERHLEPMPFLVVDFLSRQFFLDANRDGCVDAAGTLPLPEIDPADFYPLVDGREDSCYSDAVSRHPQEGWMPLSGSLWIVPDMKGASRKPAYSDS
jgi:hypothetical protein